MPEQDLYCDETLEPNTPSNSPDATQQATQTGLQYRPASPVSDSLDSPLPSPTSLKEDGISPFRLGKSKKEQLKYDKQENKQYKRNTN